MAQTGGIEVRGPQDRGPQDRGNDPITLECILTLYKQVPNSFAAAGVVTIFMIFTGWIFADHVEILLWLGVQLISQLARLALYLAYRRRQPQGADLLPWAHYYTLYMLAAGAIWGATVFGFIVPAHPVTTALTLCGLYGISAGSIPGNAYNLPGCYAFVGTIFTLVLVRTLMMGDIGYVVLGLASALFAVIMILFARVQNRTFRDGFAIRFENIKILAEMKLARERAETANLAKSQFLAAASHDLRQPLYALSLFSGALDRFALTDEVKQVVGHIQDNIAAMEGLFNGVLDLSRLEAGAVKTAAAAFPLQPLFDRLDHVFGPQALDKGLSLRLRPTTAWVLSDEVLTEQILMNLVANAVRYTQSGGVLVGARKRGGRVVIEVSDSGEGIADDDRQRIFREFVQIGNTERDRTKGLGLGLAISARTAELLGTSIELVSRPGHGSRFGLALSPAQPTANLQPVVLAGENPIGCLRVLILDDDAIVRDALALLLGGWGVDFTLAEDIATAQRHIAEDAPYQVILSDYRLREGHQGMDFLAGLKDLPARPGLALVTGDVDTELMRRAAAEDIFLIHKPVDPARLRALLNHLARGA